LTKQYKGGYDRHIIIIIFLTIGTPFPREPKIIIIIKRQRAEATNMS